MDLIKEYMSSSPESSPPEALREAPRPRECPDLEISLISSVGGGEADAASEDGRGRKAAAAAMATAPAACSTPDTGLDVSGVGDEVLSGSPGHTPYPHKRGAAPRRYGYTQMTPECWDLRG